MKAAALADDRASQATITRFIAGETARYDGSPYDYLLLFAKFHHIPLDDDDHRFIQQVCDLGVDAVAGLERLLTAVQSVHEADRHALLQAIELARRAVQLADDHINKPETPAQ